MDITYIRDSHQCTDQEPDRVTDINRGDEIKCNLSTAENKHPTPVIKTQIEMKTFCKQVQDEVINTTIITIIIIIMYHHSLLWSEQGTCVIGLTTKWAELNKVNNICTLMKTIIYLSVLVTSLRWYRALNKFCILYYWVHFMIVTKKHNCSFIC